MGMSMFDVRETYRKAYETWKGCFDDDQSKYEWAASEIFNLTTYDGNLDELFVKCICEVSLVIAARETYKYIETSEENYITYILVCQLLSDKCWIDWGTSLRGAWFVEYSEDHMILDWWVGRPDGKEEFKVPFSTGNLILLIEFIMRDE